MKMKPAKPLLILSLLAIMAETGSSHCPLCTAGIAAAGVGAAWLGVDMAVVGVFVGGFAFATGFWVAHWIDSDYLPHQEWLLAVGSFLLTVVPVLPLFPASFGFPLFIGGEYGSLLYRVYTINKFLTGSIVGAIIVALSPSISQTVSAFRDETVPFQGMVLTVVLLIVAGALIQGLMVWPIW